MAESASNDATAPIAPSSDDAAGTMEKSPSYYIRIGFHTSFGVLLLTLAAFCAYRLFAALCDVAPPFLIGTFLALLLDPVAHRLERYGIHRPIAIVVVVFITLLILVGFGAVVIPRFVQQVNNLAANGPTYINHLQSSLNEWLARHQMLEKVVPRSAHDLSAQVSLQVSAALQGSAGNLLDVLRVSAATVLQLVISILVMFYILADTDRLMGRALFLVPSRFRSHIQLYSRDVGKVFSDYIRGLVIVCSCYGVTVIAMLYALSIWRHSLAGYALLVGLTAGVLYSIPYVGAFSIAVMTFLVGFTAGGLPGGACTMICVLSVNWTYDNVVTPRIVGGGVGLHPVAAILALALGARLAGFWGLLLCVPVAASIQAVLFRIFPKLASPTPRWMMRSARITADGAIRKTMKKRAKPRRSEDQPKGDAAV